MSRVGRLDAALFGLLAITWGSSYIAIKIGGQSMGPFALVAFRLAAAAGLLLVVAAISRVKLPSRDRWPALVMVSMTGIVAPFVLITVGQRGIDAGLGSILGATTPLFGVAFAAIAVVDEPLRTNKVAGLALGFVGVAIVVAGSGGGPGVDRLAGANPFDALLIVVAAASYAVTAIVARRWLTGVSPLVVATAQSLIAVPVVAALALLEGLPSDLPPEAIVAGLWLGLVCSTLGPIVYYRLIGSIGVGRTTMVNYLVPVVGVVGGALLLGESIGPAAVLGAGLVLAGLSIANLRSVNIRLVPQPAAAT